MKKKDKKKKEKIIYVDDGSTVADMSSLSRGGTKATPMGKGKKPRATLKEQFKTYINACRHMIIPMLVTIGIISVAFGIMWLILYLAAL